jgi:hypothetical protein
LTCPLPAIIVAANFAQEHNIGLAVAIFTTHLAQNTPEALYGGIDMGFLAAGGVAVLGIVISAIKKK